MNGKKTSPASLMTLGAPKYALVKNFTSKEFLGTIKFNSPTGGHPIRE